MKSLTVVWARAARNQELACIDRELSEKIRIIRRIDFSKDYRVEATYFEHQNIPQLILERIKKKLRVNSFYILKKITLQILDSNHFL